MPLLPDLKPHIRVACVASTNVTIATALNPGDSLGGRTLVAGDLVLLAGQTSAPQNGLYRAATVPARDTNYSSQAEGGKLGANGAYDLFPGMLILDEQTSDVWRCTSVRGGTLNTTNLVFDKIASGITNGLADLADPNADRMVFWDDSAGVFAWLEPGDGLAIAGTKIEVVTQRLIFGLDMANGTDATNDIDIDVGVATSHLGERSIRLSSAITKRLDAAWAVGTNQGGLDTGSIADTTYHVFLIMRSDTGVVDALFSTSATSPTMPASYDYRRRIGSIIRASGAIVGFVQSGDEFLRKVPIQSINTNNPGTSAVTATLDVPTGLTFRAMLSVRLVDSTPAGSHSILLTSLDQTDTAASNTVYTFRIVNNGAGTPLGVSGWCIVKTNSSAQIRYRLETSDADITASILVHGWIDYRNRLT